MCVVLRIGGAREVSGEPIAAPTRKYTSNECLARFMHERNKEMYIMERQEAESEDFFCHEQMPQVGP